MLLLLDNADARPALERDRRERLLAAAVLLDLAHACLIRPAAPGEQVPAGRLLALTGTAGTDPVTAPAYDMLRRRPLSPQKAVAELRRDVGERLARQLEQTGQIGRMRLPGKRSGDREAYPLRTRDRVGPARAQLLSTLFDRTPPAPTTAAIVMLLHAADGLGALLSLNDRGWRWVHTRATEISGGSWIGESPTGLAEVNLAVTASALRATLA